MFTSDRPICRIPGMAFGLGLALVLAATPLHAAGIAVADMVAGDWAQTMLTHQGDATVDFSVAPRASDPGDSFWLTGFSKPVSSVPNSSTDTVANLYTVAGWSPASQGAVDRLDFSLDARGVFSSLAVGVTGFLRPVIEQGGFFYAVAGTDLVVSTAVDFSTLNWQLEDSADWRALNGGGLPDFSAQGAALHFGYRFGLATNCSGADGCDGVTTFTAVDNFRVDVVTVTPPNGGTVPEPAVAALLLAALAAAGLSRRR